MWPNFVTGPFMRRAEQSTFLDHRPSGISIRLIRCLAKHAFSIQPGSWGVFKHASLCGRIPALFRQRFIADAFAGHIASIPRTAPAAAPSAGREFDTLCRRGRVWYRQRRNQCQRHNQYPGNPYDPVQSRSPRIGCNRMRRRLVTPALHPDRLTAQTAWPRLLYSTSFAANIG